MKWSVRLILSEDDHPTGKPLYLVYDENSVTNDLGFVQMVGAQQNCSVWIEEKFLTWVHNFQGDSLWPHSPLGRLFLANTASLFTVQEIDSFQTTDTQIGSSSRMSQKESTNLPCRGQWASRFVVWQRGPLHWLVHPEQWFQIRLWTP